MGAIGWCLPERACAGTSGDSGNESANSVGRKTGFGGVWSLEGDPEHPVVANRFN